MDSIRRKLLGTASAVALTGGLAASGNAIAADPIKIGMSMPQTGGLGGGGKAALLAIRMWVEDVNAKGGLLGRKVEFIYYDDQSNPANTPGMINGKVTRQKRRTGLHPKLVAASSSAGSILAKAAAAFK